MPTYNCQCPKCNEEAEVFLSFKQQEDPKSFPLCFTCKTQMQQILYPTRGFVDFPAAGGGYISHGTGEYIDTTKKRKEDLRKSKSRPWEGLESEKREAARQNAYREQKEDAKLDDTVRKAYYQLSPEQRKTLTNPK